MIFKKDNIFNSMIDWRYAYKIMIKKRLKKVLIFPFINCLQNGQSLCFGEQLTQEIKCPQGKNTTPNWLDQHILQMRSSFIR